MAKPRLFKLVIVMGSAVALQAPTQAQVGPTDPLAIELTVPGNQLADGRRYFLLHKAGVSFEQAKADLTFCWRFLEIGVPRALPDFVPWKQPTVATPMNYGLPQFGLAGGVARAIIRGPVERGIRQPRMFRCVVSRGYSRYRTSEAIWNRLNTADAPQSISLQAQIAVGPIPPTPQVLP